MKLEKGKSTKIELAIKAEETEERVVQFTISKEVEDRDGDIIRATGIDLTNFNKNPVFLLCHNSHDLPVGKVTKVWVEGKSVKATVYFPTLDELSSDPNNASEKARLVDFVFHCYKTGMLNAVSVGFIPLEWTETERGYDIQKWELLEFSAVPVPANQDAIVEAVKSFELPEELAKDFLPVEKSGKKISAATREILNKIKACGDKMDECEKMLKACGTELKSLLAELDDPEEEEPEEPQEPEEPMPDEEEEKSFDLSEITNTVDIENL